MRTIVLVAIAILALCHGGPAVADISSPEIRFQPGNAPFDLRVGDRSVPYERFLTTVAPGERVAIEARSPGRYTLDVNGREVPSLGPGRWSWQAPSRPGFVHLTIRADNGARIAVVAFVAADAASIRDGHIEGYRIGEYPAVPLRGKAIYLPPDGFIRVTSDMLEIQVSPHFRIGQFLCKQQPETWPKYLVLRPDLVDKLERILAEVNRRGIRADTLAILSAYRTPDYNRAIGNGAYSRHLWGGAADVFIDTTGDGRMDDLNGDGHVTLADAEILHEIVDSLFASPSHHGLSGGLGLYGPRPHRGPFVHVDARGERARWSMP